MVGVGFMFAVTQSATDMAGDSGRVREYAAGDARRRSGAVRVSDHPR